MSREIKFRAWDKTVEKMREIVGFNFSEWYVFVCDEQKNIQGDRHSFSNSESDRFVVMQYTGLKDKNGMGLTEVYECDIIDENGIIKGSIYEMDKRETDIVIPQLGTKAWESAYKEAVVRGFNYSE